MGEHTDIQWCDSTVNPVMGCDGCELWTPDPKGRRTCYAGVLTNIRKGRPGYPPTFLEPTPFPGRMEKAARWRDLACTKRPDKPWLDGLRRKIFVSDMGDALSEAISDEYLWREIDCVVISPLGMRHDWLWLTKRPERLARLSATWKGRWPSNLWVGTSITHPGFMKRIDALRQVGDEFTTRFLSVEPQTEWIDLRSKLDGIAWCIQGGESGPHAGEFDVEWAEELLDICHAADVAYFLKQIGRRPLWGEAGDDRVPMPIRDSHGGDWAEWPQELRIRQFPKAA